MKCHHCGATLSPTAIACAYCQAPTPYAQKVLEQQQFDLRHRVQSETALRGQRVAQLERLSTLTLVLGLAGLVVCCTPASIIGVVQGTRAKKMARELQIDLPGRASAGFILSILSVVTSLVTVTYAVIAGTREKADAEAKATAIEAELGERSKAASLEHDTACKLTQAHLLRSGFDGTSGPYVYDTRCLGKIRSEGDRALLQTVRLRISSKDVDVNVCFSRGATWFVSSVAKEGEPLACGALSGDAPAPAPSAVPSPSKRR